MPDLPENHSSLAYIFYRLDDGPNAIAEARTALSMDPQNTEAYQFLALALYSNGQYSAAVHAFLESLSRDADNPDTYYDLGITQPCRSETITSAIDAYHHAIQLNPAFWQAHSNLALIFHEQGKLDDAAVEYREAKKLAPQEASIRNNLGNTYCDQGNFDAAAALFCRELYRQHPEWQQGHTCMARAYMAKKNYDSAVDELQLAVRQNPTNSADHRVLGEAMLMADKLDEGVRELRLAVALNPDSDAAHQGFRAPVPAAARTARGRKEFHRKPLRLNALSNRPALLAASRDHGRYGSTSDSKLPQLSPERRLYLARHEELLNLMLRKVKDKETNSR